ncbi:ECF transporter S component [Rathayibacter oskolensis]|uniref:ECF transporter S component n=1 Tax=Rathayibacter oskolensis TaxID=1891671 RepID=UPI00265EFBFA|nr:ECF transporter S component [Rathayibacter oskolensis]WKK72787.1 ECF transporter S component [Rathayibacter oskolensis]
MYFITHDIDMALARADRIVVVDGGGIVADATPAEIVNDAALWHVPGAEVDQPRAVLRETDFVRAARRHGPRADASPDRSTSPGASAVPSRPPSKGRTRDRLLHRREDGPWAVSSRTIVFGAVGAALYGALGALSFVIPGTMISIRPAIAIIPFVGLRFGPVAGFFTGAVGNAIVDQILGYGFLTYWNWSIANGLVGLLAGLIGYYAKEPRSTGRQVVWAAAIAVAAVVVGLLFTVTDLLLGATFEYWFFGSYLLAILATGITAVILVPVLDRVWKPLQNLAGR